MVKPIETLSASDLDTAQSSFGIRGANALIPLVRKMREGLNNACILECSDSTDYEDNSTGGLYVGQKFYNWLLTQFPTYSGKRYKNPTSSWPASIDTVGGAKTLYYYNAAKPSTNGYYLMGAAFEAIYGLSSQPAPGPDLIIFNHGKNNDFTQQESVHVAMYMAQMQMLALRWPNAGMLAYVQVPNLSDDNMDVKARALRIAAGHMGVTILDDYADFLDYVSAGGARSDLLADTVHPNQIGDDRRFGNIKRLYRASSGQFVPVRCSLADRAQNALLNGDFTSGGSGVLDNWTATNCTIVDETTSFETAARAAKLSNTATGAGYVQQSITGDALKRYAGKFMTLAARVRIPSSGYVQDSGVGVIQLSDGVTNYRCWGYCQDTSAQQKDGYFWIAVSGFIRVAVTTLTVNLYATNSNTSAGKTAIFDRAILVPGVLPRDMT